MQRNSKNLSCYAVEQKLLGTLHLLSWLYYPLKTSFISTNKKKSATRKLDSLNC